MSHQEEALDENSCALLSFSLKVNNGRSRQRRLWAIQKWDQSTYEFQEQLTQALICRRRVISDQEARDPSQVSVSTQDSPLKELIDGHFRG
jgi:hypothetical protein